MRLEAGSLFLSPSDLGRFLSCRHVTALDLAVVKGLRKKPPVYDDPVLEVLKQRGLDHEQAFTEKHRKAGRRIVDLSEADDRVARTVAAMREGADMIVQGALEHDGWFGFPDVLQRIETPSDLGAWSYEAMDTKLAKETRGTTILQLSLYSEMVGAIQGRMPEFFHVVTPEREEPYRLDDYAAYYRLVKRRLAETVTVHPDEIAAAHYCEPVDHCDMCRWDMECRRKRRADDHLSLVAGISRLQRRELEGRDVKTLAALGRMPLPLDPKPARGAAASYERVREQARVQLEGREKKAPVHELLLPVKEGEGLTRLPKPSKGDIFLDLEGDAFTGDGGREYLFGLVTLGAKKKPVYKEFWALTATEERAAFEAVIDLIMAAWAKHPDMHVYHYAPYEPAAMKRLMGRYATRETEVDRLLRGGRFIDLYGVVRQSVRASVEKYSIKDLETFYGFTRAMDLRTAGDTRALLERCLQMDARDKITDDDRRIVAAYNRDDCVSTLRLRDWLEEKREGLVAAGTDVPRPKPKEDEPSEKVTERDARIQVLIARLTADVPDDRAQRTPAQQARWLLAHMLDFHRREEKVVWWEKFRLRDLPLEDYADEPAALAGLEFVQTVVTGKRGSNTELYTFPPQDCDVRRRSTLYDAEGEFGTVEAVDATRRLVQVKKRVARAGDHPAAVWSHLRVDPEPMPTALERIATAVADGGIESAGDWRAARALLLRQTPRLKGRAEFAPKPGENAVDFAVRAGALLDGTTLPIQGPPGSGKTFTGAKMICEMVRKGRKVGVTALGHAVIENLLRAVRAEAAKQGLDVTCGQRGGDPDEKSGLRAFSGNSAALSAFAGGEVSVLGATAWLWSSDDAIGAADVLVVDEAAQMPLAAVIAASCAAGSLVLLGDPQQLQQPQRASHPEGTDASALAHILGDSSVMPPERGIFLPETWRMAPAICDFCSQAFYEGKLAPRPGLERQRITGAGPFDGAGLWRVHVDHEGNANDSPEEVDAVERVVRTLLRDGVRWVNGEGESCPVGPGDILVVAPYNRQVQLLHERLGSRGIRVGTVDKFQGQQAPVVICSMASSSPSDASRGMEFLYDLNRLNVATSRARCATILVANPRLFEPECKSPRQMKLANGLCRYAELATRVSL